MEHLRRIIIPWTDKGYNFSFKTSECVSTYVVTITSLVRNSAADSAGLRIGDGIVSINGNLLRGLSQNDIQILINNFRNSPLELTVLQNYTNTYQCDKEMVEDTFTAQNVCRTLPTRLPSRFVAANFQDYKKSLKCNRKYSRNMSDVTDNSRFYCMNLMKASNRTLSPHKDKSSSLIDANSKLQLNRVGGIMRNSSPVNTPSNNIFMTKSDKPEVKRKGKLAYLTCSPTPYRSNRTSSVESHEVAPLRKQSAMNNFSNRFSEPTTKSMSESFESNAEEESAPNDTKCTSESLMEISPVPVKIMWKCINNEEVHSPVLQACYIAVENGIFKVQEREDDSVSKFSSVWDRKRMSNDSTKSKYIYNFSYNDSEERKWEFLVEFDDPNSSVKWMHFFDTPKQNEQGRKYSRPSISELVTCTSYVPSEATSVLPSTKNEPSSKGKLHHALSRVRNFTQRRSNHNPNPLSDFRRQQEEWIQKTEPHFLTVSECEETKEVPVSICTDHVGCLNKVYIAHLTTLSLDKWQRSVTSPLIPLVVEICVKVIEKYGLHCTGIYRVSGNKLSLDALSTQLRKPLTDIDLSSDVWTDIYAISGVLKSFLRNLPDGVFPKEYYFDLLSAWKMYDKDREKRLLSVQRLLSILESFPDHPEYRHHRETLRYLARHLYLVASKSSVNKMTVKNLAVVFAPTLIRPPTETNELLMSDYRYRIELVECIINHYEWMFSPSFESACNIPPEVDEETSLVSDMQCVNVTEDEFQENKDTESTEDARLLIKEIIDTVMNLSPISPNNEGDTINQYTLIELNPNKEVSKLSDSPSSANIQSSKRNLEDDSPSGSESIGNTSTKEKKTTNRTSLKIKEKRLPKSKNAKSNFPREQMLITNKKLCALSIALISSNRHPLRSAVLSSDDITLKFTDE